MTVPSGHLNLTQLATLLEFSQRGTLAAAAEALGYTAGAVSQHVAALEAAVGQPLVARHGRRLVLSDAGQVLVGHADALLTSERSARLAVSSLGASIAGPLTVGTWGSTAATLLAPVIDRMRQLHPDVTLMSKEVDLDEVASAVRRGLVDVAFGLDYADAPLPRERGIKVVALREEPFSIAVGRAVYPVMSLQKAPLVDLQELSELRWILPPTSSQFGKAVRVGFRRRGFEPVVAHEVTDTAASLILAASGVGASVMTPLMRRLAPVVDLVELKVADPFTRELVLLVPTDQAKRSVAAFTGIVAEVVRQVVESEAPHRPVTE